MYCPPESGYMDPSSAKATQAHKEITPPSTHTRKKSVGFGRGPAISLAVRNMDEPMMPLTSNNTESSKLSPRTRLGCLPAVSVSPSREAKGGFIPSSVLHPMPNSSGASSGFPQRRQMTAEQSPQVSGSVTSTLQTGQYNTTAGFVAS